MTGIGIIGTGTIARFHADAIGDIGDASLIAVYDTSAERARSFARERGAAYYDQLDAFLSDPAISLVAICTPTGAHRDTALPAAAAGKHLLVEKPLEVSASRCREIESACRTAGVFLGSVFQTRFHPAVRLVHRAVSQGWLGRISLVTAEVKWFRAQQYYDSSGWRGTWKLDGGGALMNQSIHMVDLLRWLFGDPVEVRAIAGLLTHADLEVEDTLVATLRFPAGSLGTIAVTTGAWPGSFKSLEVCGERGHLRLEENRLVRWEFVPGSPGAEAKKLVDALGGSDVEDPLNIGFSAHRAQYLDMISAIRDEREPEIGGKEATAAVELVEKIYTDAGIGPSATVIGQSPARFADDKRTR